MVQTSAIFSAAETNIEVLSGNGVVLADHCIMQDRLPLISKNQPGSDFTQA